MRVLAVDVGCGTTDVLLWDSELEGENQTHLIIPSGTRLVAGEIQKATGLGAPVVFDGPLMGGGPDGRAMKRHVAAGLPFYATPEAAGSFDDDLDAVAAMGVTLITTEEVSAHVEAGAVSIRSGDVRFSGLLEALRLVGEEEPLDGCALAVQDHGLAPQGESDRTFRFAAMARTLARSTHLSGFFYPSDEIPTYLTRMHATAGLVDVDAPLVVGDTGPSAVWGASLAAAATPCLAVNFGNGHTLMAFVHEGRMDGVFEHHTSMLDPVKMESYMRRFASGDLTMEEVFDDGGHGTLPVERPYDLGAVEIVATGPRRQGFFDMGLEMTEASLHGDMMLTGCYGLLQGFLSRM